jgi:membrane protein YqaA with SNARE-associated domain
MKRMTSAEATARPGLLRRIYAWSLRNSEGPRAWTVMAALAFAESSFFPFPPDIMLVPMLLANRKRAFLLGAWCTLWSVLGGMLGYAIGHILYNSVGQWLISIYHIGGDVQFMREKFVHNAWLIALQGLTPVPYKILTISAGLAGVNFWFFVALSTFTRGLRFMGEATLFYFFGDYAKVLLDRYLGWILGAMLVLIIAGFVALHYIFR